MKNLHILIIFSIYSLCSLQAQDKYKNRVAKIAVTQAGQDEVETGSGVIVGQQGDEVFIVTALHVIKGDDMFASAEDSKIEVSFHQASWKSFSAKLYERVNEELDIAVLVVAVSQMEELNFENFKVSEKSQLSVDDALIALGNPLGSNWFINTTERIQDLNYNPGNFTSSRGGISPGYSGGATFRGKNGHWVGMFTDLTPNEAILVSGEYIIGLLEDWNVPHQFIKYASPITVPQ